MASNYTIFHPFYFVLLIGLASPSTSSLSDTHIDSHGSNSRSLLQAKKSCAINFETQNYTIITSQCKGPQYPPKSCCQAFKEFACPFADAINDAQSECANTMFSYININGRYPPGLFAHQCREGKEGLNCTDVVVTTAKENSIANLSKTTSPPTLLLLLIVFLLLVYILF